MVFSENKVIGNLVERIDEIEEEISNLNKVLSRTEGEIFALNHEKGQILDAVKILQERYFKNSEKGCEE